MDGVFVIDRADFAGLNETTDQDEAGEDEIRKGRKKKKGRLRLSPHDLRRTAITRAIGLGFSYRQVQMMSGHKHIRMVVRYDHERDNVEQSAINFLHYDEKPIKKESS